MQPITLKQFKRDLRDFNKVYHQVSEYFDMPEYTMIYVLLQNMGSDCEETHGYEHDKEVQKCRQIIDILRSLHKYNKHSYMAEYAYNEASMMFQGYAMSEDEQF